ncbi:precorrin-6A reductase [Filomicrobium insigne]|uniref:Precorrin-6A reductase n=1 Tax=Filomicrobium insigne TaxID=418854 RepID=A0A1H0QNW2_9HYPH|nr:cobalt-precorrin-6A reductase [Filomicrobium insigne]SDP18765.1 precorrin-6A reductase [Filomicrobium insigne]
MTRVLLLGGTTEASRLARVFAEAGVDAVFSYAGRTSLPKAQPLPTRVGGFGGAEGLARYLREAAITQVVDATHPFAAQMSRNAITACQITGVPLLAFERAPWAPEVEDQWQRVPDIEAAVAALPQAPSRIFLAIGKQNLSTFASAPHHHYLLRLADTPGALPLPDAFAIIARGPFSIAEDEALLTTHRITHVVAKNSGGEGAEAKLVAARRLRLPVIMIDRPVLPNRNVTDSVETVMAWIHHGADLGV